MRAANSYRSLAPVVSLVSVFLFALVTAIALVSPAEVQAQLPGIDIEKLVKQLDSEKGTTRELASKNLLKIGREALPYLEAALQKPVSLEFKRRAEALYQEIFSQAQDPKLPDGVIYVKLPPGPVRMEHIIRHGAPVVRLGVDKSFVEARALFLGDGKGVMRFEAQEDGIEWELPGDRKIPIGSYTLNEAGSELGQTATTTIEKLKRGSIYLNTPSLHFVWGKEAIAPKRLPAGAKPQLGQTEEKPLEDKREMPKGFVRVTLPPGKLPAEVIHLRLPPGEYSVADVERDDKMMMRIKAGKMVVETSSFYIGDGKGAFLEEAPKKSSGNTWHHSPGSGQYYERFVLVDKLKPASLYVTTPSVIVGWFKSTNSEGGGASKGVRSRFALRTRGNSCGLEFVGIALLDEAS